MDEKRVTDLIENEKEWRRFVVERVNEIEKSLSNHMAWNLVFRIVGGSAFTIAFGVLIAWVEFKLKT